MTIYATFEFYEDPYLGSAIASSEFGLLIKRASKVLDQISFDRVESIYEEDDDDDEELIENIRHAACAIADVMKKLETDPKGISSESVGGHSVSYADVTTLKRTDLDKMRAEAKLYLGSSRLLFPGFNTGEYGGTSSED